MVILALDTTTKAGSCAVLRDGVVVAEQIGDSTRSQGERLPLELAVVLDQARLSLRDVDALAVATGPGSFTGLRVGIATMQGLALSLARPLLGISGLDALAVVARATVPDAERVATWVDAWRGEVYAALYRSGEPASAPIVEAPSALLDDLRGHPTAFIGDGAAAHAGAIMTAMGHAATLAPVLEPPLAGIIAVLAGELFVTGQRPQPQEIRPVYVRRPDVELTREARAGR